MNIFFFSFFFFSNSWIFPQQGYLLLLHCQTFVASESKDPHTVCDSCRCRTSSQFDPCPVCGQ